MSRDTDLTPVFPEENPVPMLYLSCVTLRLSVRLPLICMLHHDTSTRLLQLFRECLRHMLGLDAFNRFPPAFSPDASYFLPYPSPTPRSCFTTHPARGYKQTRPLGDYLACRTERKTLDLCKTGRGTSRR